VIPTLTLLLLYLDIMMLPTNLTGSLKTIGEILGEKVDLPD
jgi:hypothetical protein